MKLNIGSTIRQVVFDVFRVARVDNEGYQQIVTPAGIPLDVSVVGSEPVFTPQRGGWRSSVTAVSQEIGPLDAGGTLGKTLHITSSVDAWARTGPTGETAIVGDAGGNGTTHLKAGATYEYIVVAGREYIQFIRDTDSVDGYIAISRVEL